MTDEFGMERLQDVILKHRNDRAADIRDEIIQAVTDFAGGYQFDDVTLVVFKAY